MNDTLYAIGGGSTNLNVRHYDENEQYTPIGYIPEFPQWIILPLLITATVVAIICKQKLPKNR